MGCSRSDASTDERHDAVAEGGIQDTQLVQLPGVDEPLPADHHVLLVAHPLRPGASRASLAVGGSPDRPAVRPAHQFGVPGVNEVLLPGVATRVAAVTCIAGSLDEAAIMKRWVEVPSEPSSEKRISTQSS